jgi:hypothetical protein
VAHGLEVLLGVVEAGPRIEVPVLFVSGNAGVAVRASSAVPGMLSPVGIEGIAYEDGDESLPLAVRPAPSGQGRHHPRRPSFHHAGSSATTSGRR